MKRLFTFLTFIFLTAPVALMARWRFDGPGAGCWGDSDFGRYFVFGGRGIMMILTIVILVLLIVWAVKAIKTGQAIPFRSQDPLTILKARYAKGEINKDEFNEMKKELM